MTGAGAPAPVDPSVDPSVDGPTGALQVRLFLAERSSLVLLGVLVMLALITGAIEPGYLSLAGFRNTLLLAAPLGIMAAAQTVLMLTAVSTCRWR